MEHVVFNKDACEEFKVAILVKETALSKASLKKHYVTAITKASGVQPIDIIAIGLRYDGKRISAKDARGFLDNNIYPLLERLKVKAVIVADATYFKYMTKHAFNKSLGSYLTNTTASKRFDNMVKVLPVPSYTAFFANPESRSLIPLALSALDPALRSMPVVLGRGVVKKTKVFGPEEADKMCKYLMHKGKMKLTCDIEGFSLQFDKCSIGTIGFSWNDHECCVMNVDYQVEGEDAYFNVGARKYLKKFFKDYRGKMIYHNAKFDLKVLIYELFMGGKLSNRSGLVDGIQTMCADFDDTQILTYLATNSAAGNTLDLKSNTLEYMGNYSLGADIKDIRLVAIDKLLTYNGEDCCATFYLYEKHLPTIQKNSQMYLYKEVLQKASKAIIQLELEGMYLHYDKVLALDKKITARLDEVSMAIFKFPMVTAFTEFLRKRERFIANLGLKKKVKPPSDFYHIKFNPNSNTQVADLLHTVLKLPVEDTTDSGAPAVGRDPLLKIRANIVQKFKITDEDMK